MQLIVFPSSRAIKSRMDRIFRHHSYGDVSALYLARLYKAKRHQRYLLSLQTFGSTDQGVAAAHITNYWQFTARCGEGIVPHLYKPRTDTEQCV